MHVMFCSTPTVHRSSVSNTPCSHLAHHGDLARVRSQTQSSKSRTENSDNSIHREVITNARRLSCAEHPPTAKSRNASKDRTLKAKSPFQGHGFSKYCILILHGMRRHCSVALADFMPGCITMHIA